MLWIALQRFPDHVSKKAGTAPAQSLFGGGGGAEEPSCSMDVLLAMSEQLRASQVRLQAGGAVIHPRGLRASLETARKSNSHSS